MRTTSYIFHDRYDFPRFHGAARAYGICSIPRAGGHYLSHLLWSTGALGSPSEYFLASFVDLWKDRYKTTSELEAIREIVGHRTSPNGIFGFKVHWDQFQRYRALSVPERIFRVEAYLFLSREDRIAQAISWAIAAQTRRWISLDPAGTQEPVYDRASIEGFINAIDQDTKRWREFRQHNRLPAIDITYERLLDDPQSVVDDIGRTLEVPVSLKINQLPLTKQSGDMNVEWKKRYASGH